MTTNDTEVTTDDEMFDTEADAELLSFTDLLDLRDDIAEVNDQLDQTAGYYAQAALVLEEQVEAAEDSGNDEKAGALMTTAEKAREVSERIDGGEALEEVKEAMEGTDGE